jgi:predicted O-methyltransferase YrrM
MDGAGPRGASATSAKLRVRKLPNVLRRAAAHPTWLIEDVRRLRDFRADGRRPFSFEPYAELLRADIDSIAEVLEVSPEDFRAAREALWRPPADPQDADTHWSARDELQTVVGTTVRLLQPDVMVETGVALGFTTAVALAGMEANGRGRLHSVDLPPVQMNEDLVGRAVPQEMRHRWELHVGPSRQVLPRLLGRIAPVDVVVLDAEHTYAAQLTEYRTVWPQLRPGGILISDDVANTALLEFAAAVGMPPFVLLKGEGDDSGVGVMRKP